MFSPNTGKYRTEKTPYLNTFQVVYSYNKVSKTSTDPPQRHATKTFFFLGFLKFSSEKKSVLFISTLFFFTLQQVTSNFNHALGYNWSLLDANKESTKRAIM